jgi:hypothetical protein
MTLLSTHVLTPPKLLDYQLLRPKLIDNSSGHASAMHKWLTDLCNPILSRHQQYRRKDKLVTKLAVTPVHADPVAFPNAELMTAFFNYCVHTFKAPCPNSYHGLSTRNSLRCTFSRSIPSVIAHRIGHSLP